MEHNPDYVVITDIRKGGYGTLFVPTEEFNKVYSVDDNGLATVKPDVVWDSYSGGLDTWHQSYSVMHIRSYGAYRGPCNFNVVGSYYIK